MPNTVMEIDTEVSVSEELNTQLISDIDFNIESDIPIMELEADFNISNEFIADVSLSSEQIEFTIDENFVINKSGEGRLPDYLGKYTITPKVKEIVLPTKDKSMLRDITIFQIPYSSVKNSAGGTTITIGLE